MRLRILKYSNRKLYISGIYNDKSVLKKIGEKGYVTISDIGKLIRNFPELDIIVYEKNGWNDITNKTLIRVFLETEYFKSFTSTGLHGLIREQFLSQPVSGKYLLETRACMNGTEL